jgi:O-acetyl-ADP-ribose deacetylase (regulator of RNase III)
VQGDITRQSVDAIVNAANSSLLGGGGVDGAIHRKRRPRDPGGVPQALRASHYGKGLRHGQAVATTAGKLDARWVIHTVGPVWSAGRGPLGAAGLLLPGVAARRADELGARTVAFPAISTGDLRLADGRCRPHRGPGRYGSTPQTSRSPRPGSSSSTRRAYEAFAARLR